MHQIHHPSLIHKFTHLPQNILNHLIPKSLKNQTQTIHTIRPTSNLHLIRNKDKEIPSSTQKNEKSILKDIGNYQQKPCKDRMKTWQGQQNQNIAKDKQNGQFSRSQISNGCIVLNIKDRQSNLQTIPYKFKERKKHISRNHLRQSFFKHLKVQKKGELMISGKIKTAKPRAKSSMIRQSLGMRPKNKESKTKRVQIDFILKPWQFQIGQQF